MKRCEKHFNAGNVKQCWNQATHFTTHGPHTAYYCDHCAEIVAMWGCKMEKLRIDAALSQRATPATGDKE